MILRFLRRPLPKGDEFLSSVSLRFRQLNGLPHSKTVRGAIECAIISNHGQLVDAQHRLQCAFAFEHPRRLPLFAVSGGICPICIKRKLPISIGQSHPSLCICLRHRVKLHAVCPQCQSPSTSTWIHERECEICQLSISRQELAPVTDTEYDVALDIYWWLLGVGHAPDTKTLNGLWHIPAPYRPLLLETILNLVYPQARTITASKPGRYYYECRAWLLRNARDWRRQLLRTFSYRDSAPVPGSTYWEYLRWLYWALTGHVLHAEQQNGIAPMLLEILLVLLQYDSLPLIDADVGILRVTTQDKFNASKPPRTGRKERCLRTGTFPHIKALHPDVDVDVFAETCDRRSPIQTLTKLPETKPKLPRSRYQLQQKHGEPIDVLEQTIRHLRPPLPTANTPWAPLQKLEQTLTRKQLIFCESEIAKGNVPIERLDATGQYRQDFGFDIERLAKLDAKQKGKDDGLSLF